DTTFPSACMAPCTVRRRPRVSRTGLPPFFGRPARARVRRSWLVVHAPRPRGRPARLRPRLESPLAGFDERVHPRLDLGLLEVMLAAHINELPLSPNQLKEYLNLPLRRPPLKLLRLHRPSTWTRALYPVQSRRGTSSVAARSPDVLTSCPDHCGV